MAERSLTQIMRNHENTLSEMCLRCAQCLRLAHETLKTADPGHLEEARRIAREVHLEEKRLTPLLVEKAADISHKRDYLKTLAAVCGKLERVGDFLERVLECLGTKIRDGILFSDRAVGELEDLLGTTEELLKCMGDFLLTKNIVLARHALAQAKLTYERANEYAIAHEERLIEGICQPRASSLYLDIIDSVKGTVSHVRDMTERLSRYT